VYGLEKGCVADGWNSVSENENIMDKEYSLYAKTTTAL